MSSLDNRWWMEFATRDRDNYLSCWLCFLFQIRFPRCSCVSCPVADQMFCFNYCQEERTRWPDEIQWEWHCYWAEIPWPGPGGRWQWAGCEAGRGWSVVTRGHHHTSHLSSSQTHLGHVPPPSFRPNYWLQLRAERERWLLSEILPMAWSREVSAIYEWC